MSIDPDLTARMDATLIAYWGSYGRAPGSEYRKFPGAVLSYTEIPLFLFNTVILTGDNPGVIDMALDAAATCIAEKGLPVLWRVSPSVASGAVRDRLEKAGLTPSENDPAMLLDPLELPKPREIEGLTIRTAEGRSARQDWAELASDAFGLDSSMRAGMSRCEAGIPEELFADQPRYVGYLHGKPVAVSSLVMAGGLAGIYAVATLPEARRRGIGAAMTLHAVAEGKRRGAPSAVLQATQMGKPVYERMRFRTVFHYECYLQS